MAQLHLERVDFLSLVDEPAVGDARFLITKRYSGSDESAESDTDADTESESVIPMDDEELKQQFEEQRKRIESLPDEVAEAITKSLEESNEGDESRSDDRVEDLEKRLEAIEKSLEDGDEDDGEGEAEDDTIEKRLEAIEKAIQQGGRKGRATQTDGVGSDSGYSQSFVADVGNGGEQ